ncbi:DNA polymerase III subunit gamma/tau [Planctobacterium marinum]|uniref:DNA polymerase III subunit gamma/tau n=1 Tax=Planctobacterium marinum TaxID=1631968 RepID=UPI001E467D9A|nr:DNA polymerase III subunit gamma/tau [Planctobacterium marinum]MCC2605533.1 DNA polymerase III subunit gamma/tau [Planctobacterium marinum]
MSYQVLARKWRPGKFSELVGQEHVVNAISNALDNNRLHHAYLFTGTRGVGKTTIARIFARSLNCEQGMSSNPCGVCSSCKDIEQGNFVDLLEIDAASRTKVEDTRELLDNVQYRPTRGDYKVYLIDEVHMLSKHSFNALLKTLEEPPPHVKFLLATTDPQKLPITILSRCLQFNLKALTREQISGQLSYILQQEHLPFDEQALALLAKSAHGSMRDALSLTDQAIAQGNGEVRSAVVTDMLGLIDNDKISRIIQAILKKEKHQVFQLVEELALSGADFKSALSELMSAFHQIALTQFVPEACKLETTQARLVFNWARSVPPEQVQLLYQIALQGRKDIDWAQEARIGFEMTVLRMLAFMPDNIAANLEKFKTAASEAAENIGSLAQFPTAQSAGKQENDALMPESEDTISDKEAEKKTLTPLIDAISAEQSPAESDPNKVTQQVASSLEDSLDGGDDSFPESEEESDATITVLQTEITEILEQAESLRPAKAQVADTHKSESSDIDNLSGDDRAPEAENADHRQASVANNNDSEALTVSNTGNHSGAEGHSHINNPFEANLYPEHDYAEESTVDDYQMLSAMGDMSVSYENVQPEDSHHTAMVEPVSGSQAKTAAENQKSSSQNTHSLLELMGTLAKVTEEEKSTEKPSSYESEKAPRESGAVVSNDSKPPVKAPEVTNDEVALSDAGNEQSRAADKPGPGVYQDDILQTGEAVKSTLSATTEAGLANNAVQPHISDTEEHSHSESAQLEQTDETAEPEELFSAESFVQEHPDAQLNDSEAARDNEHLAEAKAGELPEESDTDNADTASAGAGYAAEWSAGDDDVPWDTDDEQADTSVASADTGDTESHSEDDEEDYHELFAGPIPKVSVDFEIPFKVNDKKVTKASQLDTWSQLIEQSGIGGLNKQLALHSNYVLQGDNVKLMVSEHQRHLFTDTALNAIEEALSEALQHDVRVSAHIGEVIDTPAAVQYAINNMRQQHAEKTIHEDRGVTALCEAFSGSVLNDTIEPR